MLNTTAKFERAFERYAENESSFVSDLGWEGVPSSQDWDCARKFSDLLKHFYDMTVRISGSSYVTSNSFFNEISDLCCILNDWIASDDNEMKNLDVSMNLKFHKYWGDPEKMNYLIFWANVFDPRDKLEYMEYSLGAMYGTEVGDRFFESVKKGLEALFVEYKLKYQSESEASASATSGLSNTISGPSGSVCDSSLINKPNALLKSRYKKQKMELDGGVKKKTELEVYLSEAIVEDAENFEILKWWKFNSDRFPILSRMARDILSLPISTFASESAFSTGGESIRCI